VNKHVRNKEVNKNTSTHHVEYIEKLFLGWKVMVDMSVENISNLLYDLIQKKSR
jgi:hypothetical protein